jgi:hypothetical protein
MCQANCLFCDFKLKWLFLNTKSPKILKNVTCCKFLLKHIPKLPVFVHQLQKEMQNKVLKS